MALGLKKSGVEEAAVEVLVSEEGEKILPIKFCCWAGGLFDVGIGPRPGDSLRDGTADEMLILNFPVEDDEEGRGGLGDFRLESSP